MDKLDKKTLGERGDETLEESSQLGTKHVHVSEEDNRRIKRKTDIHILSLLCVVYFLQIADKTIIGLTAIYGLRRDANLVGNQYSTIGSIGYYAQLGAQPLAAYLLVKIRYRIFMPVIVICWSVALCGMAASTNFSSLAGCRFLLGWFEAACLPLFSLITIAYYRRSEQPIRIAAWYGTNGIATILCSAIIYGLARIRSDTLHTYQIVYLFFGLITFVVGVASYFWLSDSPATARYLTPEDRLKAVERLRANQQGSASTAFKFKQVIEMVLEPKFWLFMLLTFCCNVGAATSNVFGPIILQSIVGFTADESVLLNMVFGFLQTLMILVSSWLAQRFARKGLILFIFMMPVILGVGLLYGLPKTDQYQGGLLAGYYLFSFLFSANPLIVSWMGANVGGNSKKSAYYTSFNAFSAAGNIVAPYLFKASEAPGYRTGLISVLAIFAAMAVIIVAQIFILLGLNKLKERQRVSLGMPAKIEDASMAKRFVETEEHVDEPAGTTAAQEDLTDHQNPMFVYLT